MENKHKKNLELFKSLTGRVVVNVPQQTVPQFGYWSSKVKVYWK
jgi:hypothetical protein